MVELTREEENRRAREAAVEHARLREVNHNLNYLEKMTAIYYKARRPRATFRAYLLNTFASRAFIA